MRTKLTIPYRNRFWVVLGCLLMLAFTGPLTVTFIRAEEYGGALICAFFVLILLHGAWLRLSYGLRISEKRIILRAQRRRQVVPYDAVREVVVTFTQDKVAARVITPDEEICFVWEEIIADSRKVFPGRGWGSNSVPVRVGIRMTDRFVEKSMERLSQCEKVRIENRRNIPPCGGFGFQCSP